MTSLINASFAFAILAWIASLFVIVLIAANIHGKNIGIPLIVTRFSSLIILLFTILSWLLYIGWRIAQYRECKKYNQYCSVEERKNANYNAQGAFDISFSGSTEESEWGPEVGWIMVAISSGLSLIGSIINFKIFKEESQNL